ncbi:aspartate/glutamate racemase family protein [Shewanella woodyi]|uniref:Aspartate racemase n=1 Tax=Shewanella woodyi (strain ATCC 51908 / MS32) TaxID=392500 RepID=B1KPN9_SHEWM|nr:aspartate/glutamate racemase family protein [Shewanella woodyi]ACA86192.1 aspartate racemase [Shewanella woodyi ATCC 51908]
MKTIGLIGGMSWESTLSYYQALNLGVKAELGGLHSAKIVLVSVDFAEIEKLQHLGEWDKTAAILSEAASGLEAANADFFMICTNTMHKVADEVQAKVNIPLLHIADATAELLVKDGIKKVGLLGTQFTMAESFYKGRLTEKYGIEVLTPSDDDQSIIHRVIYDELCQGVVNAQSRSAYVEIIEKLRDNGADAVILGCTEIAMLVKETDTNVPLYDTTAIHAEAAVKIALDC